MDTFPEKDGKPKGGAKSGFGSKKGYRILPTSSPHPVKPNKTVTLNDVAAASGVSHQTRVARRQRLGQRGDDDAGARVASRGRPRLPANRVARQLVTGRSETVGIISFGTSYYGPAMMVGSVERALKLRGYGFVFASIDSLELADIRKAWKTWSATPSPGSSW